MIKDRHAFLSYLACSQQEKFWCQAGIRVGHYLAAIFDFFLFIKYVIHDNSIRSRAIIVIMDLFLILTQFSYTVFIQKKERNLHVTTKYNITINMAANMAAFGQISETEVTFLEISAVIVIQVKNTFCEFISIFVVEY